MASRVILIALLMFPTLAFANDVEVRKLCQQLPNYQSSGDVDYVPGKDVYWRDVAPADLDGGTPEVKVPENIEINISAFQAQQLGLPANTPYTPEAYLGKIRVNKNGDVYFNNQRLSQPQVQVLCKDSK